MEQRQYIKGMIVRIKKNLAKTYSDFGRSSDGEMDQMRGKSFVIDGKGGDQNSIKIKSPTKNFTYTFHADDVELYDDNVEIKYPKPETFNPVLLDI